MSGSKSTIEADVQRALQRAELPLQADSIYSRLQRTRGQAGKHAPNPESTSQPIPSRPAPPDLILDRISAEVSSNARLREAAHRVTVAQTQAHHANAARNQALPLSALSQLNQGPSSVPVDDFIAQFGTRGDTEVARRAQRRGELAHEKWRLGQVSGELARGCLPLLRVVVSGLLLLLALPSALRAVTRRLARGFRAVTQSAGSQLVLTLVVFASLALLASHASRLFSLYEAQQQTRTRYNPPGEFAILNAMIESFKIRPTPARLDPLWWQAVKEGSNRAFTTRQEEMEYQRYDEWERKIVPEDKEGLLLNMDGWVRTTGMRAGALLPPPPYPMSHSPALIALPSGTLVCAWSAGEAEGADGTGVVVSQLKRGTAIWTQPQVVARVKGRALLSPQLVFLWDVERVVLSYLTMPAFASQAKSQWRQLVSQDEGLSWTLSVNEGGKPLQPYPGTGLVPYAAPVEVTGYCDERETLQWERDGGTSRGGEGTNGSFALKHPAQEEGEEAAMVQETEFCSSFLFPVQFIPQKDGIFNFAGQFSALLRSDKRASNLQVYGDVKELKLRTLGQCIKGVHRAIDAKLGRCQPVHLQESSLGGSAHSLSLSHPTLAPSHQERDKLVMFFSSLSADHIFRATSPDNGLHWTNPERTSLPSNAAPLAVKTLRNGHMVCVFNNAASHSSRWPLSVGLSSDDGLTWPWVRDLEPAEGNSRSADYLRQLADQRLNSGLQFETMRGRRRRRRLMRQQAILGDSSRWGEGTMEARVETFPPPVPPESPPSPGEFSSPSVTQTLPDQEIHIVYTFLRETIQYVRFSEEWIKDGGTIGVFKGDSEPLVG